MLEPFKKQMSNSMLTKNNQQKLHKRVREIVAGELGIKAGKKLEENDITKQIEICKKKTNLF